MISLNLDTTINKPRNVNPKRVAGPLLAVLAVCAVFGISAVMLRWVFEKDQQNDTDRDGQAAVTRYFVDENVPAEIATVMVTEFELNGWRDSQENDADITVTIDTDVHDTPESLDLFLVLAAAEPFGNFTANAPSAVGMISSSLDKTLVKELFSDVLTFEEQPESSETGLSLMPVSELTPDLTAIPISGLDPLAKSTWENPSYPLVMHISASVPPDVQTDLEKALREAEAIGNGHFDTRLPQPSDFVTFAKTGTSVTGGPGWELCERVHGRIDYPIDAIKTFMTSADYAIISNETSFVEGCSQPAGITAFCGKPKYIQNILDMGIDVISLTGNHMCDYGRETFSNMLDLYRQREMLFFGSGNTETDAWAPLFIDTPAGRIAFIGVNFMGPAGVIAGDNVSGTAFYESARFQETISRARQDADIVWVDTHLWPEYGTTPGEDQVRITREAVEAGADIVTGVSSHEIQGMTFIDGKPVFYGLGNFLFDQMWSTETRRGIALEITAYEGALRRITVKPTQMHNYCQVRFLTGEEGATVLMNFGEISGLQPE